LLQYRIELIAHGMVDGQPGTGGTRAISVRLETLRAYRQAWMTFNPRNIVSQELRSPKPFDWWLPFFGCGFLDGRWVDARVERRLEVIEPPSILRGIEMNSSIASQNPTQGWIKTLAIDHQQDLLVMITTTLETGSSEPVIVVSLCSLKTGTYHPEAILPRLVHEYSISGHHTLYDAKIAGETLGLMLGRGFWDDRPSDLWLYIWNWKSGELILVSQA
jgi:hypothetical protein